MSIIAKNISFVFPNGKSLFTELNFSLGNQKTGLVGPNGIGKSTLFDLITGVRSVSSGQLISNGSLFRMPQNFQPFLEFSVAEVLGIEEKLTVLKRILNGSGTEQDFLILDDDWQLEERIQSVLSKAKLTYLSLDRSFKSLSGGEMSRLLFARILLQNPDFVLLDEPTNHLDVTARQLFYEMIDGYQKGMLIISHDRKLLRKMNQTMELSSTGLSFYGGDFDFYMEKKSQEELAKEQSLLAAQNTLQKKLTAQRKKMESQDKRVHQGQKAGIKSNIGKAQINYFKNKSEGTNAKLKNRHAQEAQNSEAQISNIKERIKSNQKITIDLAASTVPKGKIILSVKGVNYAFEDNQNLWKKPIDFDIIGPQRWHLSGSNGSGKSTLLKLILGRFPLQKGQVFLGTKKTALLNQDLSIIKNELSVLENIQLFNSNNILEGDLRIRLARFLFFKEAVFKKAGVLSGGEKMRLALACLLATDNAPELLILDEPTNNLDLNSLNEMVAALRDFKGALLVVSHDIDFLAEIGVELEMKIDK